MTALIVIVVIVGFVLFLKSPNKKDKYSQKPSRNYGKTPVSPKRQTTVQQRKDGALVINRGKSSQITLINASPAIAHSIVEIYYGVPSYYEEVRQVQSLLLENNVEVEEISLFQSSVRPIIESRVQTLISEDDGWESLGDIDKKEKRRQYREDAISKYLDDYYSGYPQEERDIGFDNFSDDDFEKAVIEEDDFVTPGFKATLSYLALNTPTIPPLFYEMIRDYGLANINTYYEYYGRKNHVISIADPNYRKPLENLVDVGLACTGMDMSVEELLSSLTLNKLNEISGAESRFTKKDKAIKSLSEQNNVYSIIKKNISLNSLFALKPLPNQYQEFDFSRFHELRSYYEALADAVISVISGCGNIPFTKKQASVTTIKNAVKDRVK